jgi:hypothetical protein
MTATRAAAAVLLGLLVAGCAMRTIVHETDDPADPIWWRTESRMQWSWYGAPVGQSPTDVYFPTEVACEAFRGAHPSYTKPQEMCEPVHGNSFRMPGWRR